MKKPLCILSFLLCSLFSYNVISQDAKNKSLIYILKSENGTQGGFLPDGSGLKIKCTSDLNEAQGNLSEGIYYQSDCSNDQNRGSKDKPSVEASNPNIDSPRRSATSTNK